MYIYIQYQLVLSPPSHPTRPCSCVGSIPDISQASDDTVQVRTWHSPARVQECSLFMCRYPADYRTDSSPRLIFQLLTHPTRPFSFIFLNWFIKEATPT